ncbi:hypothetical protein [Bdellovibrio sp. HCB2-146]|uniref:hypothetical protein n=1 Tax=Bdellovibrio sp. HCB2-146 TaxID=3394362 RepID=UPI0039BD80D4
MKKNRFVEAEDITLEEISDDWVSVGFGAEKFVIDTDTLYDLSFRFAAFLAYLENKEETAAEEGTCACVSSAKLH